MRQWLFEWWITLRYASVLTRSGRTYRKNVRSMNFDDPDSWVEVQRPE